MKMLRAEVLFVQMFQINLHSFSAPFVTMLVAEYQKASQSAKT
jgi:hypothetical protein